jgi:hypothetical protein
MMMRLFSTEMWFNGLLALTFLMVGDNHVSIVLADPFQLGCNDVNSYALSLN